MNKIPRHYLQQKDESYEDWKYRLILDKENKKITDLSWQEISDILRINCRRDYLSKLAEHLNDYSNYIKSKESKEVFTSRSKNKDESKFDFEKKRYQQLDIKREIRSEIRDWARAENLFDKVKESINDLNFKKPFINKNIVFVNNKKDCTEGVLLLSDWHKGLICENYWNKFNDAIFHERVSTLINKTIEYGKKHEIHCINLFVLGDMVNGLIHTTTRINNDENVVAQTISVAETLSECINILSENFHEVNVYFARGNHDRISANYKESIAGESFFDLMAWFISLRTKDLENVYVMDNNIDSEIITTKIFDKNIVAVHGHRDNPTKVMSKLGTMLKIVPDYIFMGHHHKNYENEINGCEIIMNSSLSGVDDFAKEHRLISKPSQKFMVFDRVGRVCTYNINLSR